VSGRINSSRLGLDIFLQEKFKDNKEVTGNRNSNDRQYNG